MWQGANIYRHASTLEAWCCRRMLKIKWTDKIRNEDVYRRIYEEMSL
jgi:hypothetical protein